MKVLVTGATGALGTVLVGALAEAGHEVRKTSRRPHDGDDWVVADLKAGTGLAEAVDGVDTIVHCASGTTGDAEAARKLVAAAGEDTHLVYISIVGIDRVPFAYYKGKLAAEQVIESSGRPYTILRTTQFHTLLVRLFTAAAKSPLMPVPAIPCQPIAVAEVAAELTRLAGGEPAGRAPDLGGPVVRLLTEFAREFLAAQGKWRVVVPAWLPGKAFAAFRRGGHLAPARAVGKVTFEEFLANPDRS